MDNALNEVLSPLLADYHAQHDLRQVPISVDTLRPLITSRGCVDHIVWHNVDVERSSVLAKVEFYRRGEEEDGKSGLEAHIYHCNLNYCWQRFVVTKEMIHTLLDLDQSTRISDAEQAFKLGHLLMSDAYSYVETFEPHETEEIAEVLAIETLFPVELRRVHKPAYDQGLVTDYQLALRYRIPETYVSIAMESGYFEYIDYARRNTKVDITEFKPPEF